MAITAVHHLREHSPTDADRDMGATLRKKVRRAVVHDRRVPAVSVPDAARFRASLEISC
jgi:hypothetical protein